MSLSSDKKRDQMKLMAYADGELEGAERKDAELLLATDVDAVRFVEQIGGLGSLVELGYAAKTGKTVANFDIADAVMALAKDDKAVVAKVSSLSAARAKRANSSVRVGVGLVAVLALAASVFVFAKHRTDETPMASAPPNTAQAAQPATAPTSGTGVDVSTVNSPGNSVSVFYLPTANELSTSVVVWVDETGEK